MKKHLLFLVLIMLPLVASPHDIEVKNADGVTIYYNYTNDGTELAVTYRGTSNYSYKDEYTDNVVIPEDVTYRSKTRKVTSIDSYAFGDCTGLTALTIPSSVTSIGNNAFEGCRSMTTITINSNSIVSKNYDDYYNFSRIFGDQVQSYILGDGVTSIGEYAFYGCTGLTSVTIAEGVTSIGDNAFYSCTLLTSVSIPDGVTSIGIGAFYDCRSMTSVTIPSSVTSIGTEAFYGCTKLTSVHIKDMAAWCKISFESNPLSYAHHLYLNGKVIRDLVIPSSVTNIGARAFSSCYDLTSVALSEGVTSIGENAFSFCSGVTSVFIPSSVNSIGKGAFNGCTGLTSVHITDLAAWFRISFNDNPLWYAHYLCLNGEEIKDLVIPSSVTSINEYAFRYCRGLTSVTIPSSVNSIGREAFYGCWGLTSVTIPSSVTRIGEAAFKECTGLASVTIPSSITNIGIEVFSGCRRLTSMTIPPSVTSIGKEAFYYCRGLTSVTIPPSVTSIGQSAFSNCTALTSVHITDMAAWCKISFEDNPLKYAHHLYLNGKGIKDLVIPSTVTSIGAFAFYGCTGLTSLTIPSSVTSIGRWTFYGCTGLSSVTIPLSVTSIGDYAFYGCTGLTSVTIPNSVTSIGNNAFDGVDNPTIISLIENPFTINGKTSNDRTFSIKTFYQATLYVPIGTIDKYKAAEGWQDFENIIEFDANAVQDVKATPQLNSYYTIDGKKAAAPSKGLNIVRSNKWETKKVLVK